MGNKLIQILKPRDDAFCLGPNCNISVGLFLEHNILILVGRQNARIPLSQASVVQKVDNGIHRINRYPADKQ